ncbi:hypothetical protein ASPZODRAFT_1572761 [Penicilliopsis zonata CBS 506.65]|uniref:DUF8035 domain-containing protein n=1 Tax=Penicilliopsis zonata CBS 506.65 TaxID=1073090 RepID=A0A1L9SME7_9EURO|nr:hypothetical protein ASPZODRAFT_1572761 [Penicilliopsis zonata CBS 506.65]OJJ48358.1 hypothetical protein ASPZODRAFT_1572761 [Penicilliopsis zonata CBS 506.65]
MHSTSRFRPMSPAGGRRMVDPMRASTGTVSLNPSFDPYDSSASRHRLDGYSSEAPFVGYETRVNVEPTLEVQPVSSQTYRDPGHSTKVRTEYAVRSRPRSSTTSDTFAGSPLRGPVPASSPSLRQSPIVTSSYGRTPSPLPPHSSRDGAERYIMPASGHHGRRSSHRVYSTDYASDTGRSGRSDRTIRHRPVHSGYRTHGSGSSPRHPPTGGLRKGDDIDDYDAYSYTNPREQFEKDSVARLSRGSGSRKERPLSMTGLEEYLPALPPRKDLRVNGPPPSQRGFDKIERDDRSRRHGESSSSRHRSQQHAPVSLHQEREDGYSSYREDYDGGHRYRRRRRRHHDDDEDGGSGEGRSRQDEQRSSRGHNSGELVIAGAGTGLGTAGLASGYSDDALEQHREVPSEHGRHRSSRDPDHDRTLLAPNYSRHRSRSRRASSRRRDQSSDAYTSDEDLRQYRREPSAHRSSKHHSDSEGSGGTRRSSSRYLTADEQPHRRRRSRSRHDPESGSGRKVPTSQQSTTSSESHETTAKKAIAVVDPPVGNNKGPDPAPKGILKRPRERFPEEPNPVREGVAPLKDAHKNGIPPGARWTKIDRRLVNPAALEAAHERFEERSDYVIVLRVLTKEEIQGFAVKTQEIRDARYQEYLQERRARREEQRRHGRREDSSSDDEDEGDEVLRIEGP